MGDNKAFIATTDPNAQLPNAITLPLLKGLVDKSKPVAWYWMANLAVGYDPFLVYVWKHDATDIEFSFVDCADGTLPINPPRFSASLADLDQTHGAAPSTGRGQVSTGDPDPNKNAAVVFLMLNPAAMSVAMRKAAVDTSQPPAAAGAKGKWPGTAGGLKSTENEIKTFVDVLIKRLEDAKIPDAELRSLRARAARL
jgi:hypothetical protein